MDLLDMVPLAVGGILIAAGIFKFIKRTATLAGWTKTTGTIKSAPGFWKGFFSGSSTERKYARIEYTDHTGDFHSFATPHYRGKKGDTITILYDPKEPYEAVTSSFTAQYTGSMGLILLGVFFASFPFVSGSGSMKLPDVVVPTEKLNSFLQGIVIPLKL